MAVAGSSGVWLFTGKGDGTLNPGVVAAALTPVQGGVLAAADFNGDKKLDLVFAMPYAGTDGTGNGFVVLLGNGNGTFQPPQAFAEPKRPINIVVGPLTKNGPASIALTSGSDVYLYFGNGTGGFSGPRIVNLPELGTSPSVTSMATASPTWFRPEATSRLALARAPLQSPISEGRRIRPRREPGGRSLAEFYSLWRP